MRRASKLNRAVAALTAVTCLAAAATVYYSPPDVSPRWLAAFGTLFALGFFSVLLDLRGLESGAATSMDYVPQLAAILLIGPSGAMALTAVSEASSQFLLDRQKPLVRKIFNIAQLTFAATAAAWTFRLFGGQPLLVAQPDFDYFGWFKTTLPPFMMGAALYLTFNNAIVSFIIAVAREQPYRQSWRRIVAGLAVFDLAMSPLGVLVAFLFLRFGVFALLVSIIPLIGLRYSYGVNYQLRRLNADLLRLMVKTIEAQDPYTSGHSMRVSEMARNIARSLRLGAKETETIETAALLHDIGKIDIAYSEILRQEGPLTEEQKDLIRAHPDRGVDILRAVRSIGSDILEAVRHHHERFDGDGYPAGLASTDIPLGARIIMVCDTIDAMTTARPYRGPLPLDVVRNELRKHAGAQFDPEVVAALLDSSILENLDHLEEQRPGAAGPLKLVQPVRRPQVV